MEIAQYEQQRREALIAPFDNKAVRTRPDVFTVPGMTYDYPFGTALSGLTAGQTNNILEFIFAKMGTNGDLVQESERVGARMASAVMRATYVNISRDMPPSLLDSSGSPELEKMEDSTLLTDQALRIIGRTSYLNTNMQTAYPHNRGADSGIMKWFHTTHLPFIQSLLYLVVPAEESLGYIHGDIDLADATDAMKSATVQERNHAINLMIRSKDYQIIEKKDSSGLKQFVTGTVPEGSLQGESIELQIVSPVELSKKARIGDASMATLATGYAHINRKGPYMVL